MLEQVNQETIEKWLPIIEGSGDWTDFVSECPKVKSSEYATMARLFENIESLSERTNSANGTGDYSPILIPMMRRVMPALIGPQIFGTQPMGSPSGLIFILRAIYQNDSVNTVNDDNSVILTLADATGFTVGGDIVQGGTSTGDGNGVIRHIEGNNILVEVESGTFVAGAGEQVDDADPYAASATTISAVYTNEALFNIIFSNYTGTYATATGESKASDMKEVGFNIEKTTVTAKTRKLKAKWTEELEQDLRAVHNMDAEAVLSGVASDEVIMEMNREFIALIGTKATNTTAYDYDTADGRWEFEKYQNLAAAISRAKRSIATQSKRGQGTWMIVSPAVLSVLETSGRLDSTGVDPIQKVYCGRALGMDVFVDLYATSNSIYVGYKGGSEMDAGIFYCPYIPLQIRKGYGEEDGQPRAFFSTRYALQDNPFGAANYLQTVTIANLPA